MREWSEVTRRERCPVCEGDSWCAVSSNGRVARCMRVFEGDGILSREDSGGTPYGLVFLTDGPREPSRYQPPSPPPCAAPEELHRVYSALLACLPLYPGHRSALHARGLAQDEIDRRGYRSFPAAGDDQRTVMRRLREDLGGDLPSDVPGIYPGKLLATPGLAIPVRDAGGRCLAVKIRADKGDSKYVWLSSASKDGPGPALMVHTPLAAERHEATARLPGVVRVTEGPLKADVATALSGLLTIGVQSCTAARSAAPAIRALYPHGLREVRIALDADARTNPHVARGLRLAVSVLREESAVGDFSVAVETWDATAGKGIDDALKSGAAITLHGRDAVDRVVREAIAATDADAPRKPRAAAPDPTAPVDVAAERRARGVAAFDRGDSVELAHAILAQMRAEAPGAGADAVVYDRGTFWVYDPARGIYAERDATAMLRAVSAYAGTPTGPKGAPLRLNDGAVKGAVKAASWLCARPCYFDAAPKGIVFADRFVCAREGEVVTEPHAPAHRAIHALPVAYEMDAPRAAWTGMLREVFRRLREDGTLDEADTEACIALLQEWVGAALMGEATSYAKCLVLVGPGNDGKSSVLKVIRALFPATAVCSVAPQDWGRGFLLAVLAGKRLNVVNELPARDILDADRFKAVADGSPLTAERKNQDPFDLVCEAGQMFACNDLPPTKDQSQGFWRRFLVLLCQRSFDAAEVVRDIDKIIVAGEIAGVAAWAIEGAARLQRGGQFSSPVSSVDAKADWQHDSDQVRQWIADACIQLPPATPSSEESTAEDLYAGYRAWCADTGHPCLSRNRLAGRMKGLGYEHRTSAARLYRLKLTAKWRDAAAQGRGATARAHAPLN